METELPDKPAKQRNLRTAISGCPPSTDTDVLPASAIESGTRERLEFNSAEASMNADYPAAHSNDVMWFAIDRDGHVACFDASRNTESKIPARARMIGIEGITQEGEEQIYRLANQPGCAALLDLEGLQLPPFEKPRHLTLPSGTRLGQCLFFLASRELFENGFFNGNAIEVDSWTNSKPKAVELRATSGIAVWINGQLSKERWHALHESGACLGCFECDDPAGRLDSWPAKAGMIHYSDFLWDGYKEPPVWALRGSTGEWLGEEAYAVLGLYGRLAIPTRPLTVNELSQRVPSLAETICFPSLSFLETPHLYPEGPDSRALAKQVYEAKFRLLERQITDALDAAQQAAAEGNERLAEQHLGKAVELESQRQAVIENDFPAAHSMDTNWFAVDRDGHVARFSRTRVTSFCASRRWTLCGQKSPAG